MSHYTVKFTGTRAEKEAQALNECKQWLGRRFHQFCTSMRSLDSGHAAQNLRSLYFAAGMAGMSGRTVVHALYRHIYGRK